MSYEECMNIDERRKFTQDVDSLMASTKPKRMEQATIRDGSSYQSRKKPTRSAPFSLELARNRAPQAR